MNPFFPFPPPLFPIARSRAIYCSASSGKELSITFFSPLLFPPPTKTSPRKSSSDPSWPPHCTTLSPCTGPKKKRTPDLGINKTFGPTPSFFFSFFFLKSQWPAGTSTPPSVPISRRGDTPNNGHSPPPFFPLYQIRRQSPHNLK